MNTIDKDLLGKRDYNDTNGSLIEWDRRKNTHNLVFSNAP